MSETKETEPHGMEAAEGAEPQPEWPALSEGHPLQRLIERHTSAIKEVGYDEVYGVHLNAGTAFQRNLILQKFLRANGNDVEKAYTQLRDTLTWRKYYEPLKAKDEAFSKVRFGGLGYVMVTAGVPESANVKDVVTFNIYGAVTDNKATFEDLDGFLRWRVGLMELALANLDLSHATRPIPDYNEGPDPYRGFQVHDYLSVSFLGQDPYRKAAARKTIDTFQNYYPETLSRKFFVNVPTIMGWMFSAMKLVLSAETVKKFTVIANGKDLALELGQGVPSAYGGSGGDLATAETLKLDSEG